jgi:Ca2+:H+ antiporter
MWIARNWLNLFLVFLPIAAVLEFTHAAPQYIFITACLAILPLAGWMGRATEHLSARMGAGIGGLLNATFGNAAELILAAMALHKGLEGVVKASITGSIIGNLLLVLGLSMLMGGVKYPQQKFNRTAASLGATLLALSVAGLLVPALFHTIAESKLREGRITQLQETVLERGLSLEIAIVLFAVYLLHLFFALKTHKSLFLEERSSTEEEHQPWSRRKAAIILVAATTGVAVVSEFLVGAVEATAHAWGFTEVFVGVIVVAVIGNAAEHSTAILMAMKNKMDLAINIAVGSSLQIALLVAPVLIFLSYAFGKPMDLRFTSFEVLSVTMAVGITALVAQDGETHWMEGVLLLALYVILGFAFYFLPA